MLRQTIRTISPPWLQTGVAEKTLFVVGLLNDSLVQKANEAVLAWLPTKGTTTALPLLGADRRIARGLVESDAAYAERLRRATSSWRYAGLPRGRLGQLVSYLTGYPTRIKQVWSNATQDRSTWRIYAAGADASVPPSRTLAEPMNWVWDGYGARWWRDWVILYPPKALMQRGGKWGSGIKWGSGLAWGVNVASGVGRSVNGILRQWKGKHAHVVTVIYAFDDALFDETKAAGDASLPDATWGCWGKDVTDADGRKVRVSSRSSSARYAEEVT